MKNKLTIWIVIAVVVVVGVVWFFVGRSPAPSAPNTGSNQVQGAATQPAAATSMSLKDLFAAGQSQQCTFTNTASDGAQSNGTIYVASGHMRGDFTTQTSAGQTMTSHMITDGTTSWVWTDASAAMPAEGMKMSFTASSSQADENKAPMQAVDPSQPMNYSCSGWSVDQSKFALPTNITFTDMSAMMQGAGATGAGMNAECSACNQISNSAQKAQCLAALGCN